MGIKDRAAENVIYEQITDEKSNISGISPWGTFINIFYK